MKKTIFIVILTLFVQSFAISQCYPMIKIDGNCCIISDKHPGGSVLPIWLKAGQTLDTCSLVYGISVLEFSIIGNTLQYAGTLNIQSPSVVPENKTWKIESVIKRATSEVSELNYTIPGTFTYTPKCDVTAHIKVYGGGGGGGSIAASSSSNYYGGGGGSGGFSYGVHVLQANTTYTIIVGAPGAGAPSGTNSATNGGYSSFESGAVVFVKANGGNKGNQASSSANGTPGAGASVTGAAGNVLIAPGEAGIRGEGGNSYALINGGVAAASAVAGTKGGIHGGGGGAGYGINGSYPYTAGYSGGTGSVVIQLLEKY